MNLILHQFRTDLSHFRWRLWLLWFSFAAGPVLNTFHNLPGVGVGITIFFLELWQAFFTLAIIVSLIQADPLTGDTAAWLCRPIRRQHLFWAKSAFIILCIFLPWLAAQSVDWSMRGYSWYLGRVAAEESLMFSVAVVLTVAVLAALTSGAARFFLAVGITIGGIFLWAVVVEMLTHAGILHQADGESDQLRASAAAVAWLILAASVFVAWLWQARGGRRQMAVAWLVIGLLPFPIITTVWSKNFLAPKLGSSAPLTLSMPGTNAPSDTSGQWLSSELFVSGAPDGQVAVVQEAPTTALFSGEKHWRSVPQAPHNTYQGRIPPAGSDAKDEYFRALRGYFPADTVWFNDDFYGGVGSLFDLKWLTDNVAQHLPPAKLDGKVTVDLFDVKKVADLPLQYATAVALPGLRVTIQKAYVTEGAITITIDECRAQLMFDRHVDTSSRGNVNEPDCTYVLYHPGSGEAYIVSQNNAQQYMPEFLSGESHLSLSLRFPYPALRERLAGITAADWMQQARLCVFAPVYAGTTGLAFHQDNFTWTNNYRGSIRERAERTADLQAIQQATLPAGFTDAQLDAYLDKILPNIPQNFNKTQRQSIRDKLAAISVNGLPALLDRLPLSPNVETAIVFPVITNLITRDQLPELRAALQRDDNAVDIFVKMKWEADARDIFIAKLPDHRQPLPPDALRIAAGAKDPATYADLRWHFAHLEFGHDQVIGALEACPGFDAAGAVREAWQNARLGVISTGYIATIAAKQGLPEALNTAVAQTGSSQDSKASQRQLAQLAAMTGYNGPTNDILPWLVANLPRFQFDAAQQRYVLAAQ